MTGNNSSSKPSEVRLHGQPKLITKDWDKDSSARAERLRQQEAYREEAKIAGTYGKPTVTDEEIRRSKDAVAESLGLGKRGKARKGVSH